MTLFMGFCAMRKSPIYHRHNGKKLQTRSYKKALRKVLGFPAGTQHNKNYPTNKTQDIHEPQTADIIQQQIQEGIREAEKTRRLLQKKQQTKIHNKSIQKLIHTHTANLRRDFNEYSSCFFDDLKKSYIEADKNQIYRSLVNIQKTLVELLTTHYIQTNGMIRLKPFMNSLKNQWKSVRKIDATLYRGSILQKPGEIIAQQTTIGALAHALLHHQLKQHPDYEIMDHDVELDQYYHCDLLAYHHPSNTYIALDSATGIKEPITINDYTHHEKIISHLVEGKKINKENYDNGAYFRHIIINPLRNIKPYKPIFIHDNVKYHKSFLRKAQNNISDLINNHELFMHE